MFFFFNSHSLFSMAGALQGNPFSRYERRMAFIVRHGLAFLISVAFFLLPLENNIKATLNTCIITPLTIFVNTSYYLIVACPCLQGEISSPTLRAIFTFFEGSASMLAHICCLISIVWIIVAGALTSKSDNFQTLSKYLYQVFVFGLGTEFVLLWLKFFASSFCIKIFILGVNVFTLSDWFAQMLQYQYYSPNKRWFGFPLILTVEIWTKGEPIKDVLDDVVDVDIEMGKVDDDSVKFWAVSSTTETTLPQPPSTDNSSQCLPPHLSVETKEMKNEVTAPTETVTYVESVTEQQIKTAETKEDDAVTSVESLPEQQAEITETKNEAVETTETKIEDAETVATTNDDFVDKTKATEVIDVVTTSDNKTKKEKEEEQ